LRKGFNVLFAIFWRKKLAFFLKPNVMLIFRPQIAAV
jgi:hypothetical protein